MFVVKREGSVCGERVKSSNERRGRRRKMGSNKHVGSSLDEWLEEEAAKDPSFIVGLNEQLEKIRSAGSQKARADPLKALRSRRARR